MIKSRLVNSFLLIAILFLSCEDSSKSAKEKLAIRIASESCDILSEITSSMVLGTLQGFINEMTGVNSEIQNSSNPNIIPNNLCECFTYYVSKDLVEKFTIKELHEIQKDKIKRVMVLTKLYQKNKEAIIKCIEISAQENIRNYVDFEKKLNQKLNDNKP